MEKLVISTSTFVKTLYPFRSCHFPQTVHSKIKHSVNIENKWKN